MSTNRILSRGIATLLALTPFALRAGTQTIVAFGDPTDGSEGANPSWGVAANWSGTNGIALPGVSDLAQISSDDFFSAAVDIRGTDFASGLTEVQGISFVGTGSGDVTLENNSPDNNMILALNGGGGTVPLIQTGLTGPYVVRILGVGAGLSVPTTKTLTLQLRGSGEINVNDVNGDIDVGDLTIGAQITQNGGTFGFTKTGTGRLVLSGSLPNTYAGTTTVSGGILIANKTAGVNAIGGNLVINSGGVFRYQGNNVSNQIPDTATITLNGGDFGDLLLPPTNPGITETVASVIVNSGNFSTGRGSTATTGFTTVGTFKATGGTTLVQRGGLLTVGSLNLSNGAIVNLAGSSATAGSESKLTVGAGGLILGGSTINFDSDGGVGTTSVGSILNLNGNVTATGTNTFVHSNPGVVGPKANVALGVVTRTFNITGSLTLGTAGTGESVTVSGGAAAGSITKTGPGTLSLSGTNTLTGPVLVSAGTLALNGSFATPMTIASGAKFSGVGSVLSTVTVSSGGTIEVGDGLGSTLGISSLKFGVNATDTETLNVIGNSLIAVGTSGGLTVAGTTLGSVTVNILGPAPTLGTHTLISYLGNFGAGIGAFKLGTLPSPRLTASLKLNTTNRTIYLDVTGLDVPFWTGAVSNEWSTATMASPKNWALNATNGPGTDYILGDTVTFKEGAISPIVDVSVADVAPTAVNFVNTAAQDFTLTGSKSITGLATLTKSNAGKLTINNTNSFTGTAAINGGTVSVAALADSGLNSPLGAGSRYTFGGGGTLEYTGGAASTDRAITLNGGGGKIMSNAPLTLAGAISGAGSLTKLGNEMLVLTGANTYSGGTIFSGSMLQVGDGGSSGALGTGPVTINTSLVFNRSDVGLVVPGAIGGTGTVTQIGTGTTTLSGTTANTYTGLTTVSAGVLSAGKTAGVNAIPGDLLLDGGSFTYAGNNTSNQIADTATITINSGIFGDTGVPPTTPGATDTVANVIVHGGQFNSGRNDTLTPFTINGLLNLNGGEVLVQRGGSLSANTVNYSGGELRLDGGSAGVESKLIAGAGGLTLTDRIIFLNAGPSAIVAGGSAGSSVTLNGNLTSTGASGLVRLDAALAQARVDLGGSVRTFNVTGSLDIGAQGTPVTVMNGGLSKVGAGALNLNGRVTLSSLDIAGTGLVTLGEHAGGPAGINALDTSALTLAAGTKLDLTNNAMVVRGGSLSAINAKLITGFANGNWNGAGINSSTAAANGSHNTALGIADNHVTQYTTFAGVTGLTGNEIIVKYTYYGDSNLDGIVSVDDLSLFVGGFAGGSLPSWVNGDYNYDGIVSVDDLSLFVGTFTATLPALRDPALAEGLNNLAQQFGAGDGIGSNAGHEIDGLNDSGIDGSGVGDPTTSAVSQAVVPEPGSAGLLAVGALGLLARRRRR